MPDKIEEVMALHDGKLADHGEAKATEDRTNDPGSQELLNRMAEADNAFASAADELLDIPVPAALVDAIRKPTAQAEQTEQPAQTAKIIPFPRRRGVVGLALAAGLAAIVATNTQLFEPATDPDSRSASSGYAALLQQVMETVPSGDLYSSDDGSASIAPMLSFRTQDARYCREFMARENGSEVAGVACRSSGGNWEVLSQRNMLTVPEDEAYRVAEGEEGAAETPAAIEKAADLSYEEEQAAIRSGWSDSGL